MTSCPSKRTASMDENINSSFKVVHELSNRLRLRSNRLYDPALDLSYLEAVIGAISGVEKVRTNKRAFSITVNYNGSAEIRNKILETLESIPDEAYLPEVSHNEPARLSTVAYQAATTAVTPWLPSPLKALSSWMIGTPTMAEGIKSLVTEGVKVEVLDASAVAFSLLRQDYFTANAIVAMLGLGEYLEDWTEQRSNDLLKNLLRPQVENVWVERDAKEQKIPLDKVLIGDIVLCGPGELLPVDGTVIGGEAALNTSSITGESIPVHVEEGDEVLSGSVIEEGHLRITASHVGSDSSMARIGRFLENSLRSKSSSQKKSDELADKLVPITFALGLGLYALTRDVTRAASVLTVDYSCAIKVASPVAVKSGMFAASHSGVLLKGAQALENLSKIDTVVFDKTGTLTRGDLSVTDYIPLKGLNEKELLALAAGAEEHYSHPVARAVVAEAKSQKLQFPPISQVDFIVAHGVSAFVEGRQVLVGSRHFLEEDEGVDCSAADNLTTELRQSGKSLLYVSRDGELEGVIGLRDELRPEAAEALSQLKEKGIKNLIMLTGDHRDTAKAICAELGVIDKVHWELKPEDKARIVNELQEEGHFLAFAGDGVNDAPALISADVGICMPQGAELAREAAQVVLLEDSLMALVAGRHIAEQTQKVIKNSFNAAVGINSAILLAATTGKLSPVASAFLHNSSTLGILGYAASAARREAPQSYSL
ncbi:heavy metal translocating P-type ATPase [Maridesulfovibrio bastinii]|uniref:heavy metal translocating P-type ATPase n=1 Tax=Maridesulfovibrio bastinii TaxID=47157 RepID=UPI000423CE94|nr:heavy metal translocating P-type ATPase [Maridesulfovibrio bastinii]